VNLQLLTIGAQFGGREGPNAQNLIDFPFKKLQGAETGVENIRVSIGSHQAGNSVLSNVTIV
jgi:hypothetical protein